MLFAGALLLFLRLGQEFIPTLDEKNIAMHAIRIPSTSLTQSQAMQLEVENKVSALPQVAFVFSKTGTAEIASDPMPPNASDTFIILKPQAQWPDPDLAKDALLEQIEAAARELPGNNYEFTQPIQMRFNELLAGVRGDIAVKVFGDDFEPLLRAANQIAAILRATKGAVDVKVEQARGLSVLEINVDKAAIARRGLSLAAVQDVIGTAIGGREAGVVFEGDRHFEIVVRLPDTIRNDLDALKNLPVSLPLAGATPQSVPLGQLASFTVSEGPNQISRENGKRRVVVTANVRDRDIASVVNEARAQIDAQVKLPPGYWLTWGGQFENLTAARQRLSIVVPACFVLIFLLLMSALGSARDALAGVQRGAARADGRRAGPLAARNAVLGLGRGRLYRAVGSRRAQRPGDADLHQAIDGARSRQARRHPRRRADPVAAGRDDGAGGIARLRADGAGDRHRRRSATPDRDRGDRRADQRDAADAVRAAGALRLVRS